MSEDINALITKAVRRDPMTQAVLACHEDYVAAKKEREEGFSLDESVAASAFGAPNRQLRKEILETHKEQKQ